MDRALDDIIGERQKGKQGGQNRRRNDWSRGGSRKNGREDSRRIDNDWLHDKYDDEDDYGSQPIPRNQRNRRARDRDSPEGDLFDRNVKLRVDNLHYDLTEDDLRELFTQIAPVVDLRLSYDRAGRSLGTAYVTYRTEKAARNAIAEYDNANAHGQPIRLAIMPSAPAPRPRNPFDTATKPSKSLLERIDRPRSRGRDRSRSPGARRNNRDPAPNGIDRYIPGNRRSRSGSPRRRRGGGSGKGEGRRGGRGPPRDADGRAVVQGRPRYTQEELDKDMDEYWGNVQNGNETTGAATTSDVPATTAAVPVQVDGDIDMAE